MRNKRNATIAAVISLVVLVVGLWLIIRNIGDPDLPHLGLGTLAILQQIEWARREGLDHLYLGYWIEGHAKMDYKRRFQPLEAFDGRRWRSFAG